MVNPLAGAGWAAMVMGIGGSCPGKSAAHDPAGRPSGVALIILPIVASVA